MPRIELLCPLTSPIPLPIRPSEGACIAWLLLICRAVVGSRVGYPSLCTLFLTPLLLPLAPPGTSSILAGAVMASLYQAAGKSTSTESLIHAVLHLEQVLTTGKGWEESWGEGQRRPLGLVRIIED